ncbi:hypothetical protein MBLNU230_g1548t1 [Neophaeotheca triangularis]
MASSSQLHSRSSIRDSLSNDPETNKHDTKIEHIDRVPTGAARDITALRGDVTRMVGWSVFVIFIGTFCMVAGSYGAIVGIVNEYSGENGSSAWSCADNSHSS